MNYAVVCLLVLQAGNYGMECCLTWDFDGNLIRFECKIKGPGEVFLVDNDGQNVAKCALNGSGGKCSTTDFVTAIIQENFVTFYIDRNRKTDVNGNWSCLQQDNKFLTEVLSFRDSTDSTIVDLSGKIVHDGDVKMLLLTCSSCRIPKGKNAEFLINNISVNSITFNDETGKCIHIHGECASSKCICSSSGNTFALFLLFEKPFTTTIYFSCDMRFEDKAKSVVFSKVPTVSFNGKEFKKRDTRTVITKFTDDHNQSRDKEVETVKILTEVISMSMVVAVLLIVAVYYHRKRRKWKKKDNTDESTPLNEMATIDERKHLKCKNKDFSDDIEIQQMEEKLEGLVVTDAFDLKSISKDKEKTLLSEDDPLLEDEELRQLKDQLERIRAKKDLHFQIEFAETIETLQKLINEEKTNFKSKNKGITTRKSLSADDAYNNVQEGSKCQSEDDNVATCTEGRHFNKNQDKVKKEIGRHGSAYSSINSSNAENQVSIAQTEISIEHQRQTQVENKQNILNVPIDDVNFELFISKIGLGKFHPDFLQLPDVMKIKANETTRDLEGITTMFIKKLFMINFTCRDEMFYEYIRDIPLPVDNTLDSDDYIDQLFEDQNENNSNIVNPLDLIVAVFKCSSPMLKQILAAKLFLCQLAIPFVFPAFGNNPMFVSMWPLRSLVIAKNIESDASQHTANNCPCQTVSFIRIGRPTISKSKLINELLSDQYHNTFLTKDCPLGTTKRIWSEGMIEAAWYRPLSTTVDESKVYMFLNLRGDGEILSEQINLVSNISNVVVIFMETKILDSLNYQRIELVLQQAKTGIILAIDAKKNSKTNIKQKLQPYNDINRQLENLTRCILLSIDGKYKSKALIKLEMLKGIKELIQNKRDLPLLERLRTCRYEIDEDADCFSKTRKMAEGIITLIPENSTSCSVKDIVMPLQGVLWKTWSQKNKDLNKASKFKSLREHWQIYQEMEQIRLKQVTMCEHLGPFMRLFINSLLELIPSETYSEAFVWWLIHFFDQRSRRILPLKLLQYKSDLQALKSPNAFTSMKELRSKLNLSEYYWTEASFGFEHLCREMGQIYEAVCSCKTTDKKLENLRQQLPLTTAKLLLLGLPFEIMDGDAASVPILWVEAVLRSLKCIIGDKKLLAISVIGMQSSGKSTLLNTMFGLQFAVSPGGCTRGVSMQLVHVEDSCFPFDCVIVIDTEGLRAPEFGHQKNSHYNELATFVIGLGDITIVNIKGENTAEIKDVLQIAVHAFLRLEVANKRLNLKQSCVFVHQNVSDIDANDKMMHRRQKFAEILDEMTKEAADQEHIADIYSFNQVINFDCEKNVWYFPDFWCGDPSMSLANTCYSENVTNVRNAMFDLTKKRDTYLTVTDTISRIKDLWNGILKDDFVYSFRNSLELKAYNNMERKYRALTWELEKSVLEFMKSEAECSLVNCNNPAELDSVIPSIDNRLALKIGTMVSAMLIQLDSFIDSNALKDVMIQWKQNKQDRFKILADDLIVKFKTEIKTVKEKIRLETILVSNKKKHEMEINKMVRLLAQKIRVKSPQETVLKQKFDGLWNTWIDKFASTDVLDVVSIKDQIESRFCVAFPFDAAYLERTKTLDEHYYKNLSQLEGSIPIEWISDKHKSILKKVFWNKDSIDNCKSQTLDITNKILRKIDTKLLELNAQDKCFNEWYVIEIVNVAFKDMADHKNQAAIQDKFILRTPFREMLSLHVLRYATVFITRLNDEYNRKHSLKDQMQAYKGTSWTLFKDIVKNKSEDFIALGFLRKAIMMTVAEHVSDLLHIDAQDHILSLFPNGKLSLIKDILIDLAQTEDFANIKIYIQDPRAFAEGWIIRLTNKKLFEEQSNGTNIYTRLTKSRISKIFSKLTISIMQAKQNAKTSLEKWIDQFVKHSNDSNGLPLSNDTFVHVKNQNVPDLHSFVEMLKDELDEMENDVLVIFKEKAANTFKWKTNPVISIMDNLWGCKEACVFCAEPCINSDKNHINDGHPHNCLQHRPEGIIGHRWKDTAILDEGFCNHYLNTDIIYNNVRRKTGKYREYKKNFPDWEIDPNSDVSKYWMWIFFNFQSQLKLMYNAKLPTFPVYWASISKYEAIDSLG